MGTRLVKSASGSGSAGLHSIDITAPGPGWRVAHAYIVGEDGPVTRMTYSQHILHRTTGSLCYDKVTFRYELSDSLLVTAFVVFERSDDPDAIAP